MKSWILEASQDGNNWITIDNQPSNSDLNGSHKVASFPLTETSFYRYFRIKMTGPNHAGNNIMTLSAFEIFGVLQASQ